MTFCCQWGRAVLCHDCIFKSTIWAVTQHDLATKLLGIHENKQ